MGNHLKLKISYPTIFSNIINRFYYYYFAKGIEKNNSHLIEKEKTSKDVRY